MATADKILETYTEQQQQWINFHENTFKNINIIKDSQKEVENKVKELDETITTVKTLSEEARHTGYVQISPLCHIAATIKHTGEYNVHFSDSCKAILTAKQTIDYLERKKKDLTFDLDVYENQLDQLMKRMDIENELNEFESEVPLPNLENMPEKIESEVGVALKKEGFYEILETDETPYVKNTKRISRIKP